MHELADGKYRVNEVLLYYEEPIMYTVKDAQGNLYLGQLLDDEDNAMIVPTSEKTITDMKEKRITMRQAFTNGEYAIYVSGTNEEKRDMSTVPDIDLPDKGVFYL